MGILSRNKPIRDNRRAFEREVLEHLDALYAMALRLTRDGRDAEDLVQDTMVKALRFRARFADGTNLKAWLFKILTNTFYNTVRKHNNIKKLSLEAEVGSHHDRFISSASAAGSNAEELLLSSIAAEQISKAIDELPPEFRDAVLLCDLNDFSYKEIAEILECPVGTVMSRLYRGRRLLQKRLYDYAVERGVLPADSERSADATRDTGQTASEAQRQDDPTDLTAYRERKRGS